jgi:hypothetical protein
MDSHSSITSTNGRFLTQAEKIEDLLRSRYGQWVAAYELADVALQYCARINQLRKKLRASGDSEEIENKTEWVKGVCHGSYRIRSKGASEPINEESRHDRAKRFERKFRPGWQSCPFSEKRMAQEDCFVLTPPEPRT